MRILYSAMKLGLVVVFFTSGFFSLCAQTGNTSFGLRFGPNLSTVTDSEPIAPLPGLQFGVFSTTSIAQETALRMELMFQQVGTVTDLATDRYAYITMPVLLQVDTDRIYIQFGPQLSSLLNATSKTDLEKENIGAALSHIEISGLIGILVPIGNKWGVDFRFSHGFTEVFTEARGHKNVSGSIGLQINFSQ